MEYSTKPAVFLPEGKISTRIKRSGQVVNSRLEGVLQQSRLLIIFVFSSTQARTHFSLALRDTSSYLIFSRTRTARGSLHMPVPLGSDPSFFAFLLYFTLYQTQSIKAPSFNESYKNNVK